MVLQLLLSSCHLRDASVLFLQTTSIILLQLLLCPSLSVSAEAGIISFVGGGVHIDRSTSEAQDPLLISLLSVSLFRKSSAGDGPREGELEDLHEDEPFS